MLWWYFFANVLLCSIFRVFMCNLSFWENYFFEVFSYVQHFFSLFCFTIHQIGQVSIFEYFYMWNIVILTRVLVKGVSDMCIIAFFLEEFKFKEFLYTLVIVIFRGIEFWGVLLHDRQFVIVILTLCFFFSLFYNFFFISNGILYYWYSLCRYFENWLFFVCIIIMIDVSKHIFFSKFTFKFDVAID